EWSVVDIRFDDRNKLLGFTLRNEASEESTTYGEEGGEYFLFTIDVSDGTFALPTAGYSTGGTQNVPYDWTISVDGGAPVRYTGTGSASGNIPLSGLTSGTHTIKIEQYGVTDKEDNTYTWFRAFGFGNGTQFSRGEIAELISPLPEKGLCVSEGNAGNSYASYLFYQCNGALFKMGPAFTIPQSITSVGNNFCAYLFTQCNGAAFTMGAAFNLPQNVTGSVGNSFCQQMFHGCDSGVFTMNSAFNLPQKITGVGNNFCILMFRACAGGEFTMNSVFNLPQDITTVGSGFGISLFDVCSGGKFTMNSIYNLPQKLTNADANFCNTMFQNCTGVAFKVNDTFKFPQLSGGQVNGTNVLNRTFYNVSNPQTRLAADIINGNETPTDDKDTFSTAFSDYSSIDANWRQ
ncbi:MAG: hypothetical protein LBU07_06200, partial [Coriobacteriales bacterium]|nr:hypothetical protein [Coriobacteriales bacterium]